MSVNEHILCITNLGEFESLQSVWDTYPEGGKEGDYIYLGEDLYCWDKYSRSWVIGIDVDTSQIKPINVTYTEGVIDYSEGYINCIGSFDGFEQVWEAYPNGGKDGDYILVAGERYKWNKYISNWGEIDSSEVVPARPIATVWGDLHVHNDTVIGEDLYARILETFTTKKWVSEQGYIHTDDVTSDVVMSRILTDNETITKKNGRLSVIGNAGNNGQDKSIYIIGANDDSTPATDENVYSALASEVLFLSKKKGGTVDAPVTFKKNVILGDSLLSEDFESEGFTGKGFGVTKDANGNTVLATDILKVRKSAEFYELIINQISFSRGATVHSAAGCEITSVEKIDDVYRCYYDNKDGKRHSGFKDGDQARCQRFDESFGGVIKYYWRVVAGVGDNYVDLYVGGVDESGYALVDGDGIPEVGDEIVQMGSRTDKTRQGVIVVASTPEPAILQYDGIDSFVLPAPSTKIAPNDNEFTGRMHIGAGSTGAKNIEDLPNAVKEAMGDIESGDLFVGRNLLRNSGFTGDYTTSEFISATRIEGNSKVYSDSLKYWDASNAATQLSDYSQSGVEVALENGSLSQALKDAIIVGDSYIFSVYAKGDALTFSIAGYSEVITLTDTYERYVIKFDAINSDATLEISSANATVCMLQIERGNVPSAWGLSAYDNDKALAYYQQLQYLASAIKDGSVDILGGLILANMILLGNYQDGEMKAVTAGISGIYNDSDDVAFWAGGAMEKAITTVRRFRENPRYQPTNAEWADMASFVATHGGDLFLKGYIFALGGFFRGTVSMANGKIQLNEDGSGSLADKSFVWDREGRVMRNYPDIINWIPLPNFTDGVIDHSLGGYFEAYGYDGNNTFNLPNPPFSPYKMVFQGPRVRTRSTYAAYIKIEGSGNFVWGEPGTDNYQSGKTMVINTDASKGNVEVVWDGSVFSVYAPSLMAIGGEDNMVDVQIY